MSTTAGADAPSTADPSPFVAMSAALGESVRGWRVVLGPPREPGWIAGAELRSASGAVDDLLRRIGERAKTSDRRTIAASFALRFGWTSILAIAPYLRFRCVPDISLENVSFKFKESTLFERAALHTPRGVMIAAPATPAHDAIRTVPDDAALLRVLREMLVAQAAPVVETLRDWSGFSRRGTWGMLTSAWASQLTSLCDDANDHRRVQPQIEGLFAGDDIVAEMQPRMHAVTLREATHLYQRRASCCRYYRLDQGELCASCPLVSHDERMARNREWMQTVLERSGPGVGHP